MATHIYLQCTERGTKKPIDRFNHRGEAGPNDDPASFKAVMEKRGLKVILSDKYLGAQINEQKEPL